MGVGYFEFFNKYIIHPLYKNITKLFLLQNSRKKDREEYCNKQEEIEHKETQFEKICNSPMIYSDNKCKTAEDYGEYVKIIGVTPCYILTGILCTTPQENYTCYIPPIPFLGKYSSLYYKPDEITDDLLGCFVDW
jgi:hypothetical protein